MKDPYVTCGECLVKDWCGRRSGEVKLPDDYQYNPDCGGYILLEQAVKLSKIPPEYRYANKRNYVFDEDNEIYKDDLIKSFDKIDVIVKKGINIAFIHPNKGTGKTHTACTLANEFIFKACTDPNLFDYENPLVLYMKYGAWANDLRNMYQIEDKEYNLKVLKEKDQMKTVPLLIMDDIGSGRITDYIRDLTYEIIDYRKENKLSTIITTNIPLEQLKQPNYLGDMIVSRLMFNCVLFELGGRDRREEEVY